MLSRIPTHYSESLWIKGFCCAAIAAFVALTWNWPLMGDSGYLHYVVFLTRHGWAPYRDIVEMNTPASYLTEELAMFIFGSGALGWRLFDFTLIALSGVACIKLTKPYGTSVGLLVVTLFLAVHAQDGVMVAGERDLTAAVLQMLSAAFAVQGTLRVADMENKSRKYVRLFVAGFCASWAACMKPSTFLFLLFMLGWLALHTYQEKDRWKLLFAPCAAAIFASAICLTYLVRNHALTAYLGPIRELSLYHLSLDRRSLSYLFVHSFSTVMPLVALTVIALMILRPRLDGIDALILGGVTCGLISYVSQGKGFSYQRYPALAFLILFCLRYLMRQSQGVWMRAVVKNAALLACVAMILLDTYKVSRYSNDDPDASLTMDLRALGATRNPGQIQCLDTNGPCIETLYKQHLSPSTGFFYDCYFDSGSQPESLELRRKFELELENKRPEWIVLTDSSCFNQGRRFDKYENWQNMETLLSRSYSMIEERDFKNEERYWARLERPFDYRIYKHK